ncbi:MAG: sigma factor-like helix-turn-helix DNA-binding protein [Candidatus Paceibacterales bacterium]
MKNFNYQKIYSDLLFDLTERQKEIIFRRFGLKGGQGETLESIGKDFGICRERVRQIQEASFKKIRPKAKKYKGTFQSFLKYFKKFGDLRKEDVLLADLGEEKWRNEIYFLLTLKESFQRFNENNDFYSLWTINQNSFQKAKKVIASLYQKLKAIGKPLALKELSPFVSLENPVLTSYLEISKKIPQNEEGLYGLKDWPEINPRGIRDKAYLVFKKVSKPLHFAKVADLIEGSHLQTVHNELIKDSRFILVGRGIYALAEWGYYPGYVKDVIFRILGEAKKPLTKEEILKRVLEQRLVKENTVFLNLSNKKYFLRDSEGKYRIKEA